MKLRYNIISLSYKIVECEDLCIQDTKEYVFIEEYNKRIIMRGANE